MFHLSEQSCNNFNDAFLAAGLHSYVLHVDQ